MDWSPQQSNALKAVADWYRHRRHEQQVFRLFGYAGTGKTTLARHLAEGVGGPVLFGAFTGKAALVLRRSGCPNASTIHSMIYHPRERGQDRLRLIAEQLEHLRSQGIPEQDARIQRLLREERAEQQQLKRPAFTLNLESQVRNAALVVIDECSMVDSEMGHDLLSFGTPILVLGDPAQLPPVRGGGFFTQGEPDVMLTEIHRQARDNPIIELATRVRTGHRLQPGRYGDSEVALRRTSPDEALAHDQILVGMNRTRKSINRRVRTLQGREGDWPLAGERLVCLRNDRELGLLNGMICEAVEDYEDNGDCVNLVVRAEEGETVAVAAHKECFWGDPERIPYFERRQAHEFDYGYALTVHKSQGSQWGSVMVFDEWPRPETWQRWMYTAITRAQDRVTIIRS